MADRLYAYGSSERRTDRSGSAYSHAASGCAGACSRPGGKYRIRGGHRGERDGRPGRIAGRAGGPAADARRAAGHRPGPGTRTRYSERIGEGYSGERGSD
jgi:hypothetical protein